MEPNIQLLICWWTILGPSILILKWLLVYRRNKGISFVAIDLKKPLLEQGPFDVILHKVCGISFIVLSLPLMFKSHPVWMVMPHLCLTDLFLKNYFVCAICVTLSDILFVIPSCQEKSGVRLLRFVNSEYLHLHPLSDCTKNIVLLWIFNAPQCMKSMTYVNACN